MTAPTQEQLKLLIGTLVPQWSDRKIGGWHYLSGGYSNHNYRFEIDHERYVLRAPGRISSSESRNREAKFYSAFRTQPSREQIPALIALDTSSGAMISRWQEGPLLIDQPTSPEAVCDYLNALHDILPGSDHDYDPLAVSREFLRHGEPEADIVQALAAMSWQPENPRPCHNDLNPWNVICCGPQPWVTLDWEWFGNNDPLFDLVTLHQGLGWEQESLYGMAAVLLRGSVSHHRLLTNLQVFWLREYAWAHAAIEGGSRRDEIVEQKRVAAERFRRLSD